ncbi:hypothetical protein [Breoghania sp.]|uniref:hypothetical protein n=1 Tax=Breoghania sp. TaxID=2065378 RepID=UPI0029C9DA30|nr:hypothetical protein [Breoghania sp.]
MQTTWTFANFIAQYGPLAVMTATLIWSVYQFRLSARKDETNELRALIDTVSKRLEQHVDDGAASRSGIADRLSAIEGELRHMPSADSYQRTEIALEALRGQMEVLSERLKPVSEISNRLQEFLLEEAKTRRTQ